MPDFNKKFDKLPMAFVSPLARPKIVPAAFGGTDAHIQQEIAVKLTYIQGTKQDNEAVIAITTFIETCKDIFAIEAFRSFPNNLPPGVWNIKVGEASEFKGNLLLQGYAGTEMILTFVTND